MHWGGKGVLLCTAEKKAEVLLTLKNREYKYTNLLSNNEKTKIPRTLTGYCFLIIKRKDK